MKAELFKKLIKQCVKEAMREELPLVLLEYQQRSSTSMPVITEDMKPMFQNQGSSEDIKEVRNTIKNKMSDLFGVNEPTPPAAAGGYMDFILDAANNMTPQERSGLSHYD